MLVTGKVNINVLTACYVIYYMKLHTVYFAVYVDDY